MEEKLNKYKEWMDNLSFFNGSKFIINNIEHLWELTNYIGYSFSKYIENDIELNYTKISLDETINLAQAFFIKHGFNVDIKKMIDEKTLILENKKKDIDSFNNQKKDGNLNFDENNNLVITIYLEGTIYDSIIIIHEIMHYLNQPNDKRNETSDLLTESISYGSELIFCEELKDKIYNDDRELHFKTYEKTLYNQAYYAYYIYKIIYLYKIKGDITLEKYNELFDDGNYFKLMEKFDEYVDMRKSIFKDTWYILGLPLAGYLLDEYIKDNDNFKYIKLLNENINDKSFEECLSLININNVEEFEEKIKNSIENFKLILDDMYHNQKKDDMMEKNISNICEELYKYCLRSIPQVENGEIKWILNGSVLCNILANVKSIDNVIVSDDIKNLFESFVRIPKGDIDICYVPDRSYKFNLDSCEVKDFYKISEEERTYNFVDSNNVITKEDINQLCLYETDNGLKFYAKKPQYIFLYKFKEFIAIFHDEIVNGDIETIIRKRKNIIKDVKILYSISCSYIGVEGTLELLNNNLCNISDYLHTEFINNNYRYFEIINKAIYLINDNTKHL